MKSISLVTLAGILFACGACAGGPRGSAGAAGRAAPPAATSASEAPPKDANTAAAAFICRTAREREKKVLAIFQFTDANDEETANSKKITTIVIANVGKCGLRLIDNSKLNRILEEQARGRSGLYDSETTPEMGRLIGADTLVFGAADRNSLQVRIVDPSTGEVLGATVQETKAGSSQAPAVRVEEQSPEGAKRDLRHAQLRRWLPRLFKRNPSLFLYVTSTEAELADLKQRFPERVARMESKLETAPEQHRQKLVQGRADILRERAASPTFGRRIVGLRERALRQAKKEHRRGRRGPKGRR